MIKQETSPLDLFEEWYHLAKNAALVNYNAFTLSTSTTDGKPSSRIVLLKNVDEQGFVFFTNFNSRKSLEIKSNPNAAICFYWESLKKQIRIEGVVDEISNKEADQYFSSRPRGSQVGAWASKQSQPCLKGELRQRFSQYEEKFKSQAIPRPDFWGGFRLLPISMEFWEEGDMRLHIRNRFEFPNEHWYRDWTSTQLFP